MQYQWRGRGPDPTYANSWKNDVSEMDRAREEKTEAYHLCGSDAPFEPESQELSASCDTDEPDIELQACFCLGVYQLRG